MKIELDREEVQAIIAAHVAEKFGGDWKCETSDYQWPRTVAYERKTPEVVEREAREAAETEAMMDEWRAKQAPEQATPADA